MIEKITIAFIGSGVMGTALATAAAKGIDPRLIMVTDSVPEKAVKLSEDLNCKYGSNIEAIKRATYIVFCIKPQFLSQVLDEVAPTFQACADSEEKIIVSIVAGIESQSYYRKLGLSAENVAIIRMLPNTACLIGQGFTLIMDETLHTTKQRMDLQHILRYTGVFDSLPPSRFVAGTVLTSTAPSFITMFISSLADGGVYNGLLRTEARLLAIHGVLSTAKLMLEVDKHPEQLKDDVCSPAGPAIYGVKELEDSGFRSSVINSVIRSFRRFSEMEE